MIVVLLNAYLLILFLLVHFKIVSFNLWWKLSPVLVLLLLLVGLFIPMNWGAPQGPMLVVRNSVSIVPNVAGEVIDVPVQANTPLKAGDTLFRIDPAPYAAQLQALQAQLKFQELRLGQMQELKQRDAGRGFDVDQHQAEVDQLRAQIVSAKWNLDKTEVRAPADGYVTNVALRRGARVSNLPVAAAMAFIDTSETIFGIQIAQNFARYIRVGQAIEATFKFMPGQIHTGKVVSILQAVSSGQAQVSGSAVQPKEIQAAPFVVRIVLDNDAVARQLPAGATGEAAIFTEHVKAAHLIRKVILRQTAIINYVIP